jgi:hypothetical protein
MRHISLVLVALSLVAVSAKAQDETPGQTVTLNATVPPGGVNCGSSPFYCYGVPYTSNSGPLMQGMFWSDIQGQRGFIAGLGGTGWDLGTVIITSTKFSYDSQGFLAGVDFTFNGTTTAGDNGTYQGTGHFAFTHGPAMRYGIHYYYMQAGSGFQVTHGDR